jgi:hypothetical protein
MRISTPITPPPAKELMKLLRSELPAYSYSLYGLGKEKTIMVSKSTSVGAQISIRENEITIQGTLPPPVAYFVSFLGFTEFAFLLMFLLGLSAPSKIKELERELTIFLKKRYD